MFPLGCAIVDTFEDDDFNRTFIVETLDGIRRRWVRCGQFGTWLLKAESLERAREFNTLENSTA